VAGTSAAVTGSGGVAGIGSGGLGSGGGAGRGGAAGAAEDAGVLDGARESMDAVVDVALGCQGGHPAGSQWALGDGCNTCYCPASGGTYFCTTKDCPRGDGACEGGTCGGIDSPVAKLDVAVLDSSSAACSTVNAQEVCDSRSDCHSVFNDPGTCGCATPGCCMRFSRCTDGGKAVCTKPVSIGCTIATPLCSGQYVLAYTAACYEGCVLTKACAP
jgi:hypothetical protein